MAQQEALLADFLPFAEVVQVAASMPDLPDVRDSHDHKFLALARAADAEVLVGGDQGLLALRGHLQRTRIQTATGFADWLAQKSLPPGSDLQ